METNSGAPAATLGAVDYNTPGEYYVVQEAVDRKTLIVTTPQTTNDEPNYVAIMYATQASTPTTTGSSGQIPNKECPSPLGQATRVSPATVHWLVENFECAENVSLPRSTLYSHYLHHCIENNLEPANAASFGKLVRCVFLGLRTRRLGTRGNSKYHYYGIRVKPGSALMYIDETSKNEVLNAAHQSTAQDTVGSTETTADETETIPVPLTFLSQHASYLGDGSQAIPEFPEILFNEPLPEYCGFEDVDTFKLIYRDHLEAILDAVMSLEFSTVESLWQEFWRSQYDYNAYECDEKKYFTQTKLFTLCNFKPIQEFVKNVDLGFYQNLIQVLIPDVLRPMSTTLLKSIRNFAKNLENWLTSAMSNAPTAIIEVKLRAVSAFSSSLSRYTTLNHLAQEAGAVFHNSNQIAQILSDLNRVDFHSVCEQACWVCQCDYAVVTRIENDFKLTLQQRNSLEQWASWLKIVVESALKPYKGQPNFSKAAREFLLKWNFYSSMVTRDLALKSAATFGSFYLIRLLYDDYMFYLIEHQVARAEGIEPIAVSLNWMDLSHRTRNGTTEN